jgi:hypothetical protein
MHFPDQHILSRRAEEWIILLCIRAFLYTPYSFLLFFNKFWMEGRVGGEYKGAESNGLKRGDGDAEWKGWRGGGGSSAVMLLYSTEKKKKGCDYLGCIWWWAPCRSVCTAPRQTSGRSSGYTWLHHAKRLTKKLTRHFLVVFRICNISVWIRNLQSSNRSKMKFLLINNVATFTSVFCFKW